MLKFTHSNEIEKGVCAFNWFLLSIIFINKILNFYLQTIVFLIYIKIIINQSRYS